MLSRNYDADLHHYIAAHHLDTMKLQMYAELTEPRMPRHGAMLAMHVGSKYCHESCR